MSAIYRLLNNKKTLLPAIGAIALGVSLLTQGQIEQGIAAIVAGWGLLSEGSRE